MNETNKGIIYVTTKLASRNKLKDGSVTDAPCEITIGESAGMIVDRLEPLKEAFAEFSAKYEYSTVENADTRELGLERLRNDVEWQKLKNEFKTQFGN